MSCFLNRRQNINRMRKCYLFFKRLLDIVCSFLSILVLALPMLFIAFLIKAGSKGPVFFRQKRIGKNKKLFTILKFRTMRTDAPKDTPTHLLSDPQLYITKIGKLLRKTSLDELPQVFNIFAGQMSVIGPRPALYNQDDLAELRDNYNANGVRPGLTGLAQIKGRDELELDAKARLDGEYVDKMSLWLDIKIFFGTFLSVFKSKGMREGKAETGGDIETKEAVLKSSDSIMSENNDETIVSPDIPAADNSAEI